jgi:hypothetical protein
MKTSILIILLAITAGYTSQASEDLFLKGHNYELQGQDSLANVFYGRACKEDPQSSSLLEIYSKSLLKVKDTASYLVNLRIAGEMRIKEHNWNAVYLDYKALFGVSKSLLDGNVMSLAIFKDGIENNDSLKINCANKIWDFLIKRAITYKFSDITDQLINTRSQAYEEAASFKAPKKKCPSYLKVRV